MSKVLIALIAAGFLAPIPAMADPVLAMSPMLMVGTTGVMAANDANARQRGTQPRAHSPFAAGFRPGPPDPKAASISLAYTPTKALQQQAEQAMLRRLERQNPAAAQALGSQFAQHDFGAVFKGLVEPFGLRDDDAVDIMTAYTVLDYLIASGAADPSRAGVRAVRERVAAQLAGDPQFAAALRPQLGEEIKLLFVTLHAGWQTARRDGGLPAYAEGVTKLFAQQSGVDLRRLTLTAQGFVAR